MNLFNWLRPGIKIKRWLLMAALGLAVFVLGVSKILFRGQIYDEYMLLYIYLTALGILMLYAAIRLGLRSIFTLLSGINVNYNINRRMIGNLLYEQRFLVRGPRIVAIGGGTGLSTMLRGLKEYTSNITAIVTVADDGGGSGSLREDLKILPPGDIRNCLVALAHTEPLMEELMQYRFNEGSLKGQSFGNLFIAAMHGISDNFEDAIKKMSDVLAVKGRVYPVTLEDVTLCAELENGMIIHGESNIPIEGVKYSSGVKRVFLEPAAPKPLEDALFAIENADCIIMGPGSLYTSVLPNLVIPEISQKVRGAKAIKIYVSNIMTQPGETDGYNLSDHISAIEEHCGGKMINFIIANNGQIPEKYYQKYRNDNQDMVLIDRENISDNINIIKDDLVYIRNGMLRHNSQKLANDIMKLILKYGFRRNRRKIIDYYYLSERVKEKQREVD
jgi:uncharacterized cofD-like protein